MINPAVQRAQSHAQVKLYDSIHK